MLQTSLQGLKKSPTLAINEQMAKMEASGQEVFKFGFGQSPFPVPDVIVDSLRKHADKKAYLPVQGYVRLREEIAIRTSQRQGVPIDSNQIIIGPGSKELIWSVILSFPGEILLPSPSWVSYGPQAQIAQKQIYWIHSNPNNNWIISPEDFESACSQSDRPKLIILNYPNNPTGSIPSETQLDEIIAIARKYGVLILHDNIYGRLSHASPDISILKRYPEGTILSDGLSKWCGAGGWRLGFHIFPKSMELFKEQLIQFISETFSCVSTPIQYAAVEAFRQEQEIGSYIQKCNEVLRRIAHFVDQKLNKLPLLHTPSQGGFYFFPIFIAGAMATDGQKKQTSIQFVTQILKETGVALLPGTVFGRPASELSARLAYVDFDGQKALTNVEKYSGDHHDFVKQMCPQIYTGMHRLTTWVENHQY